MVRNADGSERLRFLAFEGTFTGGVTVATADVTGDGVADIVAVPGIGGGGIVKVFDSTTGLELASKLMFEESFRGGLNLAVGDLRTSGHAQIVIGSASNGAPRVAVWDVPTNRTLLDFFAHDSTRRGGVTVAITDLIPGKATQIVTGAASGTPEVAIFSARDGSRVGSFPTGDTSFLTQAQATNATNGEGLRGTLGSFTPTPLPTDEIVTLAFGEANSTTHVRSLVVSTVSSANVGQIHVVDPSEFIDVSRLS